MINNFVEYMGKNGWSIELAETKSQLLPNIITDRYINIPEQWLEFFGKIKCMVNPDETTWFLCAEDFNIQGDLAFQWNEWEIISLESAVGDHIWEEEIKKFWDSHLPIIMSVQGGYSYYAISMEDGSVVWGTEPEFEECEVVAASFMEFMEKIIKGELRL